MTSQITWLHIIGQFKFITCHCARSRYRPRAQDLLYRLWIDSDLAPVVQTLDSAIHRINLYPADSVIDFCNTYPLDSDLSSGYCYPTFEQPGPGRGLIHQA